MELDDMKASWQLLDRRLQRQEALQLQLLTDRRLTGVRRSLRPLFWGQLVQLLVFGVPFVLLAAALWIDAGSTAAPLPWPTLVAGIVVHAYGAAVIALSGGTLGMIHRIDYAAPVVDIQKQLGKLRRFHVVNGLLAGLPWWFLWMPVLMVLAGLGGADLYARAPSVVWVGMGIGIAGLLGTWWFHHWSRSPRRPRLARAMRDGATGGSLRRAQGLLDEIERFARE